MKVNEIQIGDWLYYKGQFNAFHFKVESIIKKKVGYHAEPNDHRLYYIRLSECKPIPLTAEILEKNLATEPQIAWCIGWNKKDDIHVEIKREDLNASFYGVIDFVHQLQHALRLCGITREIIL